MTAVSELCPDLGELDWLDLARNLAFLAAYCPQGLVLVDRPVVPAPPALRLVEAKP